MELKYKVWDKVNEKIYMVERIYFKDNNISHVGIDCEGLKDEFQVIDVKLVELLPSTGVKDINKKDAYLGDILKDVREKNKDLVYVVRKAKSSNNMYIECHYNTNGNQEIDIMPLTLIEDLEIVGNIFENQDMIKKEV